MQRTTSIFYLPKVTFISHGSTYRRNLFVHMLLIERNGQDPIVGKSQELQRKTLLLRGIKLMHDLAVLIRGVLSQLNKIDLIKIKY